MSSANTNSFLMEATPNSNKLAEILLALKDNKSSDDGISRLVSSSPVYAASSSSSKDVASPMIQNSQQTVSHSLLRTACFM
jgi:hypothetical protein